MTHNWSVFQADERQVRRIAERIALKIRAGDAIALHGDLGAGKTTLARALIRALLDCPDAEVPSPTFPILQTYDTPRLAVAHLDLYRIAGASETLELGIDEMLQAGAIIVEWPERAPSILPEARLEIHLSEEDDPSRRTLKLTGHGSWARRLARIEAMSAFLARHSPWDAAQARYLQGDASARAYARLASNGQKGVLMNSPRQPDGPPIRNGLAYSRIAHLAEDVRPFVAIADALRAGGLSAPDIFAADLDTGFLVLEDFGDRVFGREIASGCSQDELWRAATEALVALRRLPVPASMALEDGSNYALPRQDRGVLQIEAELLVDWYWPALLGASVPADARASFLDVWNGVFDRVLAGPQGWVLRDYHSPNLIWLEERKGAARVGIIDFQDALNGPAAYDLVSLLQDARLDVPEDLEASLLAHYCRLAAADGPSFDRHEFAYAYAALGAQRNTKIIGIFARLAKRDHKPAYLAHIPRIWRYLERDLAHPELRQLRAWYDTHLPPERRARVLEA